MSFEAKNGEASIYWTEQQEVFSNSKKPTNQKPTFGFQHS